MRALFAVALIALGIAGVAAASAADLPIIQSDSYSTRSYAVGHRTAPMVVYDFQPGVVVRAYWLAPWRNRHYFPATGHRQAAADRARREFVRPRCLEAGEKLLPLLVDVVGFLARTAAWPRA